MRSTWTPFFSCFFFLISLKSVQNTKYFLFFFPLLRLFWCFVRLLCNQHWPIQNKNPNRNDTNSRFQPCSIDGSIDYINETKEKKTNDNYASAIYTRRFTILKIFTTILTVNYHRLAAIIGLGFIQTLMSSTEQIGNLACALCSPTLICSFRIWT